MNEGKVARLKGRLAQVERIAAGLREQIAAAEAPDEVVEAVAPPVPQKAARATRTSKKAAG